MEILTTEEAKRLIAMLKEALIDSFELPNSAQRLKQFDVKGENKTDLFTISVFTGSVNPNKHNYSARMKLNGQTLLELHLNPNATHRNPDGIKIKGNHWHIYTQEHNRDFAYPAADIQSDDFVENTVLFLEKFHVVKKPELYYQASLE